jgi:UDP-N-acetylmuramoyl-tripeptide--D-alanyl-D-alanine ligase
MKMYFNKEFILSVLKSVIYEGSEIKQFQGCSIDSRTAKKGEIFIALKGNYVDGHEYILDALEKEVQGIIIDKTHKECLKNIKNKSSIAVIIVEDTKQALLELAHAWRMQFSYPVIGITGSMGKTSTKELLSLLLTTAGKKFIASYDNQNTELGIALNLLKMQPDHEVAVFEMGITKRGEMAKLASLVRPTIGIITGVGHSHMEGLGSIVDIASEKRDIFKYFKEDNIGIINGDQPVLAHISYAHPIIKFGSKTINQVQARKININNNHINFILKIYNKKYPIILQTTHLGRINNILAIVVVAYLLDISYETILGVIQKPFVIKSRYEHRFLKNSKGILIDDSYNANPDSMKAALFAFEKFQVSGRKVAVLGDMLQLGVTSPFWHRQLGRVLRKINSLEHLILVGKQIEWTKKRIPSRLSVEMVDSWEQAVERVKSLDGELAILVKGSRGMSLNKLVDHYTV